MSNKRGKSIDKTFLSLDTAERRGFIHRDYVAHCFRWSHAIKHMQANWRNAVVLDVGCGKEMPLPKSIYTSKMRPLHYVGVDVDETPLPEMLEKATFPCDRLVGDIAEVESFEDLGLPSPPNFITCFEVLEHVELEHAQRCLAAMRAIAAEDCTFMASTPCYNLKDVADNHVNEMTYTAFGAMLEDAGWEIINHYGTFASQKDYKPALFDMPGGKEIYEALSGFYDSNVLSVIFAPMFPHLSRNVLWECKPANEASTRYFPALEDVPAPWGSAEMVETGSEEPEATEEPSSEEEVAE